MSACMLLFQYQESKPAACCLNLPASSLRSSSYMFISRYRRPNKSGVCRVDADQMLGQLTISFATHLS